MDIRRTILWMILSFSLLLLWNNWQVHNGNPSLFGASPAATQEAAPAQNAAAPADTSIPSAAPAAGGATPIAADNTVPANNGQAAATASEKVRIKTDVYDLTFDTMGAQLVKAELLKYAAPDNKDQRMVLLDNSANS